jgi:hypothetical protein
MASYMVILNAPAEDYGALERGREALGDDRVVMISLEDEPRNASNEFIGMRTVVHMQLDEPTKMQIAREARVIYDGLRLHAGLHPGTGHEMVGMSPMNRLMHLDPKSIMFFGIAERLFDEGNYIYSVVAVQTAFELYMEGVFEYVLQLRSTAEMSGAVSELIRNYNLDDRRIRAVWESLTGHRITASEQVWKFYKDHLERRHDLVYRGERVTRDEAAASLSAVNELATQIAIVVRRLQPQFSATS